jgi:hypothetical protein
VTIWVCIMPEVIEPQSINAALSTIGKVNRYQVLLEISRTVSTKVSTREAMKGSASSAIGHKGEIFVSGRQASTVARHDRNHLYWVMLVTGSVMTLRCDQLRTNVWEYNSVPLLVKVRRDFSTSHCHHACNWTPTRLTIWLAVTCW